MARDGMTVVSSIHQPSSRVFYSFDRLVLLADGHVIYSGSPKKCLGYLSTLGLHPAMDYNPADFLMDLVSSKPSDGHETPEIAHDSASAIATPLGAKKLLIDSWNNDETFKEAVAVNLEQEKMCAINISNNNHDNDVEAIQYMASYSTQFFTLFQRALIISKADVVSNIQVFQTITMSLISGAVWWRMPYRESTINDRAGFIFFFMTFWFFMTLFQGMMQFLPERTVILKERAAGSYHLSAYFLSKTLSETPVRLFLPFLYLAISFPMTRLSDKASTFFSIVGIQLLAALSGESIGLFIGTSTMDYEKAMVIATLVSLSLMLTGGYFVQNLPPFVHWIRYISPFKYSYDACLQLSFEERLLCEGGSVLPACVGNSYVSGDAVSSFLGASQSVALNAGMLLVFIFCFRVLAYLSLRFVPHNSGRV